MTTLSHSQDDGFIAKLTDILSANLENENFGVRELASSIGLSRSQLHRKLHAIKGESASQFIREYRLQKALKLLKSNIYTVAEVAYKVGFASPTYFNTCFNDYFGYSPGKVKDKSFISLQEKDLEEGATTAIKPWAAFIGSNVYRFRLTIISILTVVAIGILFFFYHLNSNRNNLLNGTIKEEAKTIAIIPFKNLSEEIENQYYADGIMASIQSNLNKMSGIKVISSTSMEQYRETVKTASEIAEDLGVSYLLEASVQQYEDKIRIIVRLIEAKKDHQIWSETYDRSLKDIFAMQTEISEQIAKKLNANLSLEELKQVERMPTDDLEAYSLYLKGKYFKDHGGEHSFENSNKYYQEAIDKDPEFALAYSGLADLHFMHLFTGLSEGTILDKLNNIRQLALIATALDEGLAEPHSILGSLEGVFNYNWKEAEKELVIAIGLDPGNYLTRMQYARILFVTERFEEAMEQLSHAQLLNPLCYYVYSFSAIYKVQMGNYAEASEDTNKALEINKGYITAYWINFDLHMVQGNYDLANKDLQCILELDPKTSQYSPVIAKLYKENGIDEIFKWLIDFDETLNEVNVPFFMAQKYSFLGEKDKALELLENSLELRIPHIIRIKHNIYFRNLHTEPRFLALLKKMNLSATYGPQNSIY
ncbi:helix-turn-helix domain-containing protein [Arenibacter certesii]|uniref:HTH araC/xylS-type domain-containing protein n=1 Tax=Arenibacter certesii TaxID=228955 RepID=A0A918MJU9_9FLAO|nr:helix-turn-helix domain-containing protein [Arenibacter certesii]GGW29731.1 hypothetical protein GCM10007383_13720 [Arenibacter certesii]